MNDKCQADHMQKAGPKIRKLSLVDLSGPFLILVLGLSVSFLVFLVELVISRWKIIRACQSKPNQERERPDVLKEAGIDVA